MHIEPIALCTLHNAHTVHSKHCTVYKVCIAHIGMDYMTTMMSPNDNNDTIAENLVLSGAGQCRGAVHCNVMVCLDVAMNCVLHYRASFKVQWCAVLVLQ